MLPSKRETIGRSIESIICDVIDRRANGEMISDESVLQAYPDILGLKEELAQLQSLEYASIVAKRSGPAVRVLAPLSMDELTQPIDVEPTSSMEERTESHLAIHGYQLAREISRGGQGAVFEARQVSTGRRVAIKVISGGAFITSHARARFNREAAVLASLDHPNIVQIVDRGRASDGSFFFVMEYVEGASLDQQVDALVMGSASWQRELIKLFIEIASAVDHAHEMSVVHRDLKPSNVRLDAKGRPHVLDFGLVHLINGDGSRERTLTCAGQVVGSLPWISPEQASGYADVDHRSDIYSLGVMLYESVTGRFPYQVHDAIPEVLRRITSGRPAPAKFARDGKRLSAGLQYVLMKALEKDPEARYASAQDLADDLRRVIEGGVLLAQPTKAPRAFVLPLFFSSMIALAGCIGWIKWNRAKHVPLAVDLPRWTNSIGMEMVRLPAGNFTMGSPREDGQRRANETQHPVTLTRDFSISKTEVTQGQYRDVMGTVPEPSGDDKPVEAVSWKDANEFCRQLSVKEGRTYRLPTEAEWEYACRGGTQTPFANGEDLKSIGWYEDNSDRKTHSVGQKQSNAWGLFDMHGNAAEWCLDGYVFDLPEHAVEDPVTATGDQAVIRGGDCQEPAYACRSAGRRGGDMDRALYLVGFRVVLIAE